MFNLIKNEYIKSFRKKTTILILAGILLASALLPLVAYDRPETLENEIKYYKQFDESYYFKSYITVYEEALKRGVETTADWRMPSLQLIVQYQQWLDEYEISDKQNYSDESDADIMYDKYGNQIQVTDSYYDDYYGQDADPDLYDTYLKSFYYFNFKKSNYDIVCRIIDDLWKNVENADYSAVALRNREMYQDYYDSAVKEAERLEKITDKTDHDVLMLANSKKAAEMMSMVLKGYELYEQKRFDGNSQQATAFSLAKSIAEQTYEDFFSVVDEKTAATSGYTGDKSAYKTYGRYLETCKRTAGSGYDYVRNLIYSIESGTSEFNSEGSARFLSVSYYYIFFLVMLFILYIGSSLMSREYTTKTINMLLIRPVTRTKILMSKLLYLLSVTTAITLLSSLVFYLSCGFVAGFGDLFGSYIFTMSGNIVEIPFILWYLSRVFVGLLPLLALTCIVFMFSTLFKSGTLSLFAGAGTVMFSFANYIYFIIGREIIPYNPFPYLLSFIKVFDVGAFNPSYYSPIYPDYIGSYAYVAPNLSFIYGSIVCLAVIAITTIVSITVFKKKDIKS